MMIEEGEYGEFKGSTESALREIQENVRIIRAKLDNICVDHEKRLWSLESNTRFSRWIFMAILALLTFLGLKP